MAYNSLVCEVFSYIRHNIALSVNIIYNLIVI